MIKEESDEAQIMTIEQRHGIAFFPRAVFFVGDRGSANTGPFQVGGRIPFNFEGSFQFAVLEPGPIQALLGSALTAEAALQREAQLTIGDGKLWDFIQLPHRSAYKFSLQGVRAGAGHFQPPRPRGRQAIDINIPAAVEFLVVDGSSVATECPSCDENYSHCAYFTKLYTS
jgi:hypothetical protein